MTNVIVATWQSTPTKKLCSMVVVDDDGELSFGDPQWYTAGGVPSVSVNELGTVVEVHPGGTSESEKHLYSTVGTIDVEAKKIDWGDSDLFDDGVTPAVVTKGAKVGDDNVELAVSVYQSASSNNLYSTVGSIDSSAKTIEWADHQCYTTGQMPSVSLGIDASQKEMALRAVAVHQASSGGQLWSVVGSLEGPKSHDIDWSPPSKYQYTNGLVPAIAVSGASRAVEVHQGFNKRSSFYYGISPSIEGATSRRHLHWNKHFEPIQGSKTPSPIAYPMSVFLLGSGVFCGYTVANPFGQLFLQPGTLADNGKTINWMSPQQLPTGSSGGIGTLDGATLLDS